MDWFYAYSSLSHQLRLCSNSPFWYCDAGMNYVIGEGWRDQWDVVIASAGKFECFIWPPCIFLLPL